MLIICIDLFTRQTFSLHLQMSFVGWRKNWNSCYQIWNATGDNDKVVIPFNPGWKVCKVCKVCLFMWFNGKFAYGVIVFSILMMFSKTMYWTFNHCLLCMERIMMTIIIIFISSDKFGEKISLFPSSSPQMIIGSFMW